MHILSILPKRGEGGGLSTKNPNYKGSKIWDDRGVQGLRYYSYFLDFNDEIMYKSSLDCSK